MRQTDECTGSFRGVGFAQNCLAGYQPCLDRRHGCLMIEDERDANEGVSWGWERDILLSNLRYRKASMATASRVGSRDRSTMIRSGWLTSRLEERRLSETERLRFWQLQLSPFCVSSVSHDSESMRCESWQIWYWLSLTPQRSSHLFVSYPKIEKLDVWFEKD